MSITEKLNTIQIKLKAPKSQKNNFGNYYYRNCEDILEAVKPLLAETGTILTLSDNIELIGSRFYVLAVATLQDGEGGYISTSALAREPEVKKGMDECQITGTASSYARKYALNGLFAIDDNKDSDAIASQSPAPKAQPKSNTQDKALLLEQLITTHAEVLNKSYKSGNPLAMAQDTLLHGSNEDIAKMCERTVSYLKKNGVNL